MATDSTGSLDSMDMEYVFASKKLKANVPKLDYAKYAAMTERPGYHLVLEHVHGYMGYDTLCRNNLHSLKSDDSNVIVYNVGCLAVIHDLDSNEQNLFREHQCPITSLTVHPELGHIATSSLRSPLSSTTPIIYVWNPKAFDPRQIMSDEMVGEVRHLTFSPSSHLLFLTCGDAQKNTQLMAFNLDATDKPVINMEFRTIANKNVQIYGMAFNPKPDGKTYADQCVVFGSNILYWCQTQFADGKPVEPEIIDEKNIKFRYCKINKLQPKGSTDGKKEKAYHCALFLQCSNENNIGYYVLGGQSGTIYMGYRNTIICSLAGHNGRVQSLQQFAENMFISVGSDGTWKVWNVNYDHAKFKEMSVKLRKKEDAQKTDDSKEEYEFEEKRSIPDASADILKSGALKVICEDAYTPPKDTISKSPHACYYDADRKTLYIGTTCNSIVAVSNINTKNGAHDVGIICSGHSQGIVGVAISPKLDSLIATLSEEGLLRLWNVSQNLRLRKESSSKSMKGKPDTNKRVDNCVGLLSLLSQKQQNKLKSTVIAWSPDGKYIATGYSAAKVSLCTTHPLNKVLDIDLSLYKTQKGKPIKPTSPVTALCFSYDKSVLAVAHSNQLSLFNIEKITKKPNKWENTVTLKDNIKYIYFSEEDNILGVVTDKYESKYYDIKMKKRTLREATSPPKCDVVWWPRVPITSYVLKGLYQRETLKWKESELIDADICESLQVAASADEFGAIRLHELPAVNEEAHHLYRHHSGAVSKVLFIADQELLISVGLEDRSIMKWSIEKTRSAPNSPFSVSTMSYSTRL